MTHVIAGSINRTPTGPHRRCVMFKSFLAIKVRRANNRKMVDLKKEGKKW